MPSYELSNPELVKVSFIGKIIDPKYTQVLIDNTNLSLERLVVSVHFFTNVITSIILLEHYERRLFVAIAIMMFILVLYPFNCKNMNAVRCKISFSIISVKAAR